ncbi:hypothetical protein UQW22_11280 [Isoptericola halotolerans]|uniref:hypothetical protein n=1 Tax=Isoptericola halotolerans TaxID=300560 RepID=UPI003890290F
MKTVSTMSVRWVMTVISPDGSPSASSESVLPGVPPPQAVSASAAATVTAMPVILCFVAMSARSLSSLTG